MLKDKNLLLGFYSNEGIKKGYSLSRKSSHKVFKIEKLCKKIQKLSRTDDFINTEVGISIMMNIDNRRITALLSGNANSVYKSLELTKQDLSEYEELEKIREKLNKEAENENN